MPSTAAGLLLTLAADHLVLASSRLATRMRISQAVVGVVVIGLAIARSVLTGRLLPADKILITVQPTGSVASDFIGVVYPRRVMWRRPRTPYALNSWMNQILGSNCLWCGISKPVLMAHLRDWPSCRAGALKSQDNLAAEQAFHNLGNVVPLCANCHLLMDQYDDITVDELIARREQHLMRPAALRRLEWFVQCELASGSWALSPQCARDHRPHETTVIPRMGYGYQWACHILHQANLNGNWPKPQAILLAYLDRHTGASSHGHITYSTESIICCTGKEPACLERISRPEREPGR